MRLTDGKEEKMADIITDTISELRRENPMYNRFLFDKTKAFLQELYADKRVAPKGSYTSRSSLLFACGQGFLTGYGAAVDGEYHEDRTDVAEEVTGRAWWDEMVRLFDGRELRPFTLARASLFSRTTVRLGTPDPFLYYSGYGFVSGFEQGLDQIATGEVDYIADDDEERARSKDFIRRCTRAIAYDAVMEDFLRVEAILYDGEDADDELDDEPDDAGDDHGEDDYGDDDPIEYLDEHWDEECDALERVGGFIRTIETATRSYIEATCERRSGFYAMPEEIVLNRIITYVDHYLNGYCVQAFGEIEDGDIEEFLDGSEGDIFSDGFGTDYGIEQDSKFGRLKEEDIPLARAYVRNFFWSTCEEFDLDDRIPEEEWDEMDLPVPHPTDCFWAIAGVAFANGARQAVEEGRSLSDEGKRDYLMLLRELQEEAWDDEDDEGEDVFLFLPADYGDMSLRERFSAMSEIAGREVRDATEGRLIAIDAVNSDIMDAICDGSLDESQVLELDEHVRSLYGSDAEFRQGVDDLWDGTGNVFLCHMAEHIRRGETDGHGYAPCL